MLLLLDGSNDRANYKNLNDWSCAIGYGAGSGSPMSPSFNFGIELAKSSEVCSREFQLYTHLNMCLSVSLSLPQMIASFVSE